MPDQVDFSAKAYGPVYIGASYPKPSNKSTRNILSCVSKRIGAITPKIDRNLLAKITVYTRAFCRENFKQIDASDPISFHEWLALTPYPPNRKQQLIDAFESLQTRPLCKKDYDVKAFIKEESYNEVKCPRGIYSRTDRFKVYVGPLIAKIQKIVFSHPAFIKTVPVQERSNYIENLFADAIGSYYSGDYTAYESHFTRAYYEAIEFVAYDYLVGQNPIAIAILSVFKHAVSRINHIIFTRLTVNVEATRMSGEMNTSLGNGLVNLIIISFICNVIHGCSVILIVEGDDSLFCTTANVTSSDFLRCGLTCKLEKHDQIHTASFCGLIYHPLDRNIITDPIKVILKTPYLPRKWCASSNAVHMQLLKAKAMSILWQYPGCPILVSYAKWILRNTAQYQIRTSLLTSLRSDFQYSMKFFDFDLFVSLNSYRKIISSCPNKPIGINTRLTMEDKFGITVDYQKALEEFFDSQKELKPFHHPIIDQFCSKDAKNNFRTHVFEVGASSRVADCPTPVEINSQPQNDKLVNLLYDKTSKMFRPILLRMCHRESN